ncbi:aminopeptidase N [Nocardioides sp. Bht2]|uniref:aminopeptidase N n=1 Tax=Nocardioides sp. Bht2 TaxID=3392297 RepID=UPI0039B4FDD3
MASTETSQKLPLQLSESIARRALLDELDYEVQLDLLDAEEEFTSRTRIRFRSKRGTTFLDLTPRAINAITLDGVAVDVDLVRNGRLPLDLSEGSHELVVEAVMAFRNDGEGLHLSRDPADDRRYVYGMSFMDAAPSIFACFDQPDLKAPYTFQVRAPKEWSVIGNAPGTQVEPGVWHFERSQPLSTYFVTLVAGPWHLITDEHDGIPLALSARQSIAEHLERDAEELLTVTKQCFDEFHRLFGIRYPFGNYHQAFVPEFNAGAMENPGCVTFRDPLIFTSKVTRGERIQRATTVAHEMAHQWFGNITTPRWWDDLWLNESFAEYMGNRVTADVTEFDDAWTHNSWSRRQWGLIADQRPSTHPVAGNGAVDALAALQDFDGISYAKGSSILRQLNARLGDETFFAGVIDHLTQHRFGNATMADLFGAWERAGAGELTSFTEGWLRTAGPDTLHHDAALRALVRLPADVDRPPHDHTLSVALLDGDTWRRESVEVTSAETPVPAAEAVVVDPDEETWALALADPASIDVLIGRNGGPNEPAIRAGLWNNVRSALHNAEVSPAQAIDLAAVTLVDEQVEDAFRSLVPWLLQKAVPLTRDPAAARARLHEAFRIRADSAEPGSTLQLGAMQGLISTASDVELLDGWRREIGLPDGVTLDLALRWRIIDRLAVLGAVDETELAAEFRVEPSTQAAVALAGAHAALPNPEAKAWAWLRFTGAEEATNYELAAIGAGLWAGTDLSHAAPYQDRYFDEIAALPAVHSGWVLGEVADAFFPIATLSPDALTRADALIAEPGLDLTVRRRLVDAADELRRRLAVVEKYS